MAYASAILEAAPLEQHASQQTIKEIEYCPRLRRVGIDEISASTAALISETRGTPRSLWARVVSGVAECHTIEISRRFEKPRASSEELLRSAQTIEEEMPRFIPELVFSGLALIMERHISDSAWKKAGMIRRISSEFSIAINFSIKMLSYELGITSWYPSPKRMGTATSIAEVIQRQNKSLYMDPKPRKVHEHLCEWHSEEITRSIGSHSRAIAVCFMQDGQPVIDTTKVDALTESVREILGSNKVPHYRKKLRFWDALTAGAVLPSEHVVGV